LHQPSRINYSVPPAILRQLSAQSRQASAHSSMSSSFSQLSAQASQISAQTLQICWLKGESLSMKFADV
jgi:hypothetical protein